MVTAILLVAASVAVFGLDAWRSYFEVTAAQQVRILEQFNDFGPMMVTSVMVSVARTFGASLHTGFAVQIAVAIPVIAVAMWAVRQTADPVKRASVLVTATLLAGPYAMVYDFPALAAVIVWRLCGPQPLNTTGAAILLSAWLTPLAAIYLNSAGLGLAPLAVLGAFAIAVGDVIADNPRARNWGLSRRVRPVSGASAAPSR
jgi:hypothetical protein